MCLIAFDLDNTLGFFYHIGIWSDFFSVDTIENSFNKKINPGLKLSSSLKAKLRRAEALYIKKLLASSELLKTILRPNLDELIKPLIKNKRKVRSVAIYSNTWNSFTPHIAKAIIETVYKCPGLFDVLVDATHSIRKYDWKLAEDGSPAKTFKTVKAIFRDLCNVKGPIDPCDVLFVDDREPKHLIEKEESKGLVYLKPTAFDPKLTSAQRQEIFKIGLDVLDETNLLTDEEYLNSDVFFCKKYTSTTTTVQIKGINNLFKMVSKKLMSEGLDKNPFKDDSNKIRECMRDFFK